MHAVVTKTLTAGCDGANLGLLLSELSLLLSPFVRSQEGFYVTCMATSHTRWAVVMSRNAGIVDQCVELDFQYPSEGIHRR